MTAVRAALNFERNLVGRSVTEKTKAEATYRSETIRPRATYQLGRYPNSDALAIACLGMRFKSRDLLTRA